MDHQTLSFILGMPVGLVAFCMAFWVWDAVETRYPTWARWLVALGIFTAVMLLGVLAVVLLVGVMLP